MLFLFPESKKAKSDIKKAASDTMRIKKKVMKGNTSAMGEFRKLSPDSWVSDLGPK